MFLQLKRAGLKTLEAHSASREVRRACVVIDSSDHDRMNAQDMELFGREERNPRSEQ